MKKKYLAILMALLLLLGLTACGGSTSAGGRASYATGSASDRAPAGMDGYWRDDAAYGEIGEPEAPAERQSGEDRGSNLPEGVKMIYRASLELETTEFDQADRDIKALTKQLGGYFEEQSARNRSGGYRGASYTVRVPAERFEEFLAQIGTVSTVTYQTQSAEDVSEVYYDMESRLETARIKLDRLQELLSKAEIMEDIITLESAISETEYQIERLSGDLRHYDSLIGYSTINVSLNEVYRVSEIDNAPLTFGQRIANSFREGLRDFGDTMEVLIEWLAYSWLSILVLVIIVVAAAKLIRRAGAKKAAGEKRSLFRGKDKKTKAGPSEEKKE